MTGSQLVDLVFGTAILVVVAVFGIGEVDPIKRTAKVPMCRVAVRVEAGQVVFDEKTELVWNDFLLREVAKDPHNYCGRCGSSVACDKLVYK